MSKLHLFVSTERTWSCSCGLHLDSVFFLFSGVGWLLVLLCLLLDFWSECPRKTCRLQSLNQPAGRQQRATTRHLTGIVSAWVTSGTRWAAVWSLNHCRWANTHSQTRFYLHFHFMVPSSSLTALVHTLPSCTALSTLIFIFRHTTRT